jgi:C4-dicarboxylate-specific signal transduction histidine kinase
MADSQKSYEDLISELSQALQTIATQEMSLEEGQRLRAVGMMSPGIAHEISNPISIIIGRAQLLRKMAVSGKIDLERLTRDLTTIESTAEQIVKLIRGFRKISRDAHEDPFESVRVKQLVTEVSELQSSRLTKNRVQLQIRGPDAVLLECRPAEISQVLINLISNSIEALEHSTEKKILIAWYYLDNNLVLSVSDSGPGVPENLRECLMRPFFTTKAVGQNTGLGLNISKKICESHGGSLKYQVQSAQTEFVLTLPLVQPKPTQFSN